MWETFPRGLPSSHGSPEACVTTASQFRFSLYPILCLLRLTDLVSERNPHPEKASYMQISESQGLFPRIPPAIVYIYVYMEVGERKEEI